METRGRPKIKCEYVGLKGGEEITDRMVMWYQEMMKRWSGSYRKE